MGCGASSSQKKQKQEEDREGEGGESGRYAAGETNTKSSAGAGGSDAESPQPPPQSPPARGGLAEQIKLRLASKAMAGVQVFSQLPEQEQVLAKMQEMQHGIADQWAERTLDAAAAEPAGGLAQAYELLQQVVLKWDIFGGDTRVYLPGPQLEKDMVIATSTCISKGMYPLSFDNVSELSELEVPGEWRRLRAVTTSRDANIVDGLITLDVTLSFREPQRLTIMHRRRVRLVHQALRSRSGGMEVFSERVGKGVHNALDRLEAAARGSPMPPQPQMEAGGGFLAAVQAKLAGAVLDGVDVFSKLPDEAMAIARIENLQRHIVAERSTIALPEAGEEAFDRARAAVLRWDVYGGDTKVYLPEPTLREGMLLGVSTCIGAGVYPLSFENVAVLDDDSVGAQWRRLRVVVTTRHENIVDGNYDVELTLWHEDDEQRGRKGGDVTLTYQKRQNLVHYALRKGAGSMESYAARTRKSVEKTLARLSSIALTGAAGADVGDSVIDGEEVNASVACSSPQADRRRSDAGESPSPSPQNGD
eukprot:TRINITY_DN24009_c0_g1_i1.p1 TRINITY_DN24009_c0_g1~~TRINITY_DN24009_c0_g1_i1.p1  ORF type:complete len:580 (+),score=194.07 TRINITY_DN24009_c0_g1_i1:144-1742(+)